MSQYKIGTVTVTSGSPTITGSGTEFLANVAVGSYFQVAGESVLYQVASVTDDVTLTLSANYVGATMAGKSYVISVDFTTRFGIPTPNRGDIEVPQLLARAMNLIDLAIPKLTKSASSPAVSDSLPDYRVGDRWVNTTSKHLFVCVDETAAAAVWKQAT